jgi:hypothetical protein
MNECGTSENAFFNGFMLRITSYPTINERHLNGK